MEYTEDKHPHGAGVFDGSDLFDFWTIRDSMMEEIGEEIESLESSLDE